jgi:hypothetical protein
MSENREVNREEISAPYTDGVMPVATVMATYYLGCPSRHSFVPLKTCVQLFSSIFIKCLNI